mgnify:CR=1 FL=1
MDSCCLGNKISHTAYSFKDRIQSLLLERNVENEVVSDFIAIFENCELARYTPITNVTMQADYDKAAKTISLIDKQAR